MRFRLGVSVARLGLGAGVGGLSASSALRLLRLVSPLVLVPAARCWAAAAGFRRLQNYVVEDLERYLEVQVWFEERKESTDGPEGVRKMKDKDGVIFE